MVYPLSFLVSKNMIFVFCLVCACASGSKLDGKLKGDIQLGLLGHLHNVGQLDDLLSGLFHVVAGDDPHVALVNEGLGLLHSRSLEPNHEGDVQTELAHRINDSLRNDIALHDSSKDVDKNGADLKKKREKRESEKRNQQGKKRKKREETKSHMGIRGNDLEGLSDLLGIGTSSHIEEVGWVSSVDLDDIHGGHGQTSSVHEAANGSVKTNVVQAGLRGGDLPGVFLGVIAELKHLLLPEVSIVIKVDLGIHARDLKKIIRKN